MFVIFYDYVKNLYSTDSLNDPVIVNAVKTGFNSSIVIYTEICGKVTLMASTMGISRLVLMIAILAVIATIMPLMGPVDAAQTSGVFKKVRLETDESSHQNVVITGTLTFTNIYPWGTSMIKLDNGPDIFINYGDIVTLVINHDLSQVGEEFEFYLGSYPEFKGQVSQIWVDGHLVASNVYVEEFEDIQVDPDDIDATIDLHVTRSKDVWTLLQFDGTTIINGDSSDDIHVIGIDGNTTYLLELEVDDDGEVWLNNALAETLYVNGSEVPEFGLAGLFGLGLLFLLALTGGLVASQLRAYLREARRSPSPAGRP